MASKSNKKIAAKRTSQLRKQHSHIKTAKPQAMRKEVQQLLGVTSKEEATQVADANKHHESKIVVDIDVDKLVGDVVERLKAEIAPPMPEPDPVINQHKPEPSPVETAMFDVINASEQTEKLLHELGVRLAPVLKESKGDVSALGRVTDVSAPLVDSMRQHVGHITLINGKLLDLLDRLAT